MNLSQPEEPLPFQSNFLMLIKLLFSHLSALLMNIVFKVGYNGGGKMVLKHSQECRNCKAQNVTYCWFVMLNIYTFSKKLKLIWFRPDVVSLFKIFQLEDI